MMSDDILNKDKNVHRFEGNFRREKERDIEKEREKERER